MHLNLRAEASLRLLDFLDTFCRDLGSAAIFTGAALLGLRAAGCLSFEVFLAVHDIILY